MRSLTVVMISWRNRNGGLFNNLSVNWGRWMYLPSVCCVFCITEASTSSLISVSIFRFPSKWELLACPTAIGETESCDSSSQDRTIRWLFNELWADVFSGQGLSCSTDAHRSPWQPNRLMCMRQIHLSQTHNSSHGNNLIYQHKIYIRNIYTRPPHQTQVNSGNSTRWTEWINSLIDWSTGGVSGSWSHVGTAATNGHRTWRPSFILWGAKEGGRGYKSGNGLRMTLSSGGSRREEHWSHMLMTLSFGMLQLTANVNVHHNECVTGKEDAPMKNDQNRTDRGGGAEGSTSEQVMILFFYWILGTVRWRHEDEASGDGGDDKEDEQ